MVATFMNNLKWDPIIFFFQIVVLRGLKKTDVSEGSSKGLVFV